MHLLLKNAHIIDGSGGEPFRGDILVAGGKISAIGAFPKHRAEVIIDCAGATATPGFVDIHSAGDHHGNLLRYPDAADYLEGGVTSAIGGHEGISLAPFAGGGLHEAGSLVDSHPMNADWRTVKEFIRTLSRRTLGVNFGTLVGLSSVRRVAGGTLALMRALFSRSIEEGALGISARFEAATKGERGAAYAVARQYDVPLVLAVGEEKAAAIQEITRIKEGERPAIIVQAQGLSRSDIEALEHIGAYAEVETSEFTVTPIGGLLPEWARAGGRTEALARLKDEWMREKIMKELPPVAPEELVIVHAPRHQPLVGMTLREFMEHHEMREAKRALVALMTQTGLRLTVRAHRDERGAMRELLNLPNVLVGEHELGSYPPSWREMSPRRGFLALLEDVKREGVMQIQELVKKITAVAATRFGLENRGMLKEGAIADILVTKDGFAEHVLVGGAITLKNREPQGIRRGRPLTRSAYYP